MISGKILSGTVMKAAMVVFTTKKENKAFFRKQA
jgi:hypothetical protein